jgi:hypothetical protein
MAHNLQADERQRDQGTFEAVHHWGFAYFDAPLEALEAKAIQADHAERRDSYCTNGQGNLQRWYDRVNSNSAARVIRVTGET